jgi:xanthine dehydrogenase accessory factor
MTARIQSSSQPAGLLSSEDVLPHVQHWQSLGLRVALVTLVGVEGGAPRHAGAQMAVAEDGRFAGYLSGGCLESAVVVEAQKIISDGCNMLVRYGRGSPYFDIKLPCGSGLDLYFDQALDPALVANMMALRARRQAFSMRTILPTGQSTVEVQPFAIPARLSSRDGDAFTRVFTPAVRLAVLGNGPAVLGIAALAAAAGIELTVSTSDEATGAGLTAAGIAVLADTDGSVLEEFDAATAAVLVFHDHAQEPQILRHLLVSNCFYIGALGSHAVHRQRLDALTALGAGPSDLVRIRAPMGSIANAKSTATLAISVLGDIFAEAKGLNLVM